MEKCNVSTIYASDGEKAVEVFSQNPNIDLILMDVQMPGLDGFEATKKIKEINADVPIIAQTAFAQVDDKEKALAAGCDDFVTKPLDIKTLVEVISKYIA